MNDILAGAVIVAQVVQRNRFVTETSERHISNLDQMKTSGIGEDAGLICIHTADDIFAFGECGFLVALKSSLIYGLSIAKTVNQSNDFHSFGFLFLIDSSTHILNRGFTRCGISLLDHIKVMTDDPGHALMILKDILVGSDILQSSIMIFQQGIHFQTDQLVQTHLEDCSGLTFCKIKGRSGSLRGLTLEANAFGSACHQAGFGLFDILAATQDFDDQVNDIGGTHETFLDFLFLQFLGKKLLVLAGGQVILKIKEIFNNALETKRLRTSVGDGQHIHAESIFQTCLLIEKCQQIVHVCLFLQFQNDTNSFLGGLIGNIDDVRCLLAFYKGINIIEKFADIGTDHCIRNLGDDKAKLAAFVLLNLNTPPKLDLAAAGFVNIQ